MKHYEMNQALLAEIAADIQEVFGAKGTKIKMVSFEEMNKGETPEDGIQLFWFGLYTDFNKTIRVVSNHTIEQFLSTLFHEICHFKQYQDGRMKNILSWKGELTHFLFDGIHYDQDYPYDMRPWEKEAIVAETTFWIDYAKKTKKTHLIDAILKMYKEQQA